jgi:nucleoside-diphosphate-sugar epimerase
MRILVTGNNGYIGTVLTDILHNQNFDVVGLDNNFFEKCNLTKVGNVPNQIIKDIRDVSIKDVNNIDAIIHLASLSNDPLGELIPKVTEDINYKSTIKLANLAKKVGVKRFVNVSSQSMYGVSNDDKELDEDHSKKNPLTVYATTKWKSEIELNQMSDDNFIITSFRPSTVFGVSPRLRCDIIFNYFVACAYTTGKIEILSDGTPRRPAVHIKDVCQAIIAGIKAPKKLVNKKSFNVGIKNGNFTVKELAKIAQKSVPGSQLLFLNKHTDSRTYKVSFNRIFSQLGNFYKPQWNLETGAKELINYFKSIKFTEEDFRGRKCNRLKQIHYLKSKKFISDELKKTGI